MFVLLFLKIIGLNMFCKNGRKEEVGSCATEILCKLEEVSNSWVVKSNSRDTNTHFAVVVSMFHLQQAGSRLIRQLLSSSKGQSPVQREDPGRVCVLRSPTEAAQGAHVFLRGHTVVSKTDFTLSCRRQVNCSSSCEVQLYKASGWSHFNAASSLVFGLHISAT